MKINPDHMLETVEWVISPNCDDRPSMESPSLIVIHGITLPPGEFGGPHINELFTNCLNPKAHPYFATIAHLRVSTHVLIRRDGAVVQYVPFHRRAWHAGISEYMGKKNCNDFSIGIELEGTDEAPYEDVQYEKLAAVINAIWKHFPSMNRDAICGHSDIAPGRKTDPGPYFSWEKLWSLLRQPQGSA